MAGHPGGIEIRLLQREDAELVRAFRCANPGQRWTRDAERVIRDSPDELGDGVSIATAITQGSRETAVVGVIVFGIDPDVERYTVFSLGVDRAWRRQGIGLALQESALAELAASVGQVSLSSQVHRRNDAMHGLNAKLSAHVIPDPEDGELLLTVVVADPQTPDEYAAPSAP